MHGIWRHKIGGIRYQKRLLTRHVAKKCVGNSHMRHGVPKLADAALVTKVEAIRFATPQIPSQRRGKCAVGGLWQGEQICLVSTSASFFPLLEVVLNPFQPAEVGQTRAQETLWNLPATALFC